MDTLNAWVKHIILLVLFATFLELLIPSNSYKKFVKVIMGLLILLAVLQPVLDMMQKQWDETDTTEVTARNVADDTAAVLHKSTEIQTERDRLALEQYRKELIKQIRVLAGAVDGVSDIKAEVALHEGKGEKSYGTIKKITVYAKAGHMDPDGMVKSVKPVEIAPSIPSSQEYVVLDEPKQEQIKKVVTEFYHLKTEQVIVNDWPGK